MSDFKLKNKGVALFVVLATVFVVVVLANIALNVMVSQSRFTHHKVGRIQAYYAAWAAINYANEMLRTNTWDASAGDCAAPVGCDLPPDLNFPGPIQQPIKIFLAPSGTPNCPAATNPPDVTCISVQVQYVDPTPD